MQVPVTRFVCLIVLGWSAVTGRAADCSSGGGSIPIVNTSPVTQNFDTLSGAITPSNLLPAGWYLTETGTSAAADGSYVVGTGSSNSGGAYSFGATGSTDRALGSVGSGTLTPILDGAKFTNNAGGPITSVTVSYASEMWRRGNSGPDGLTFAFSTSATALNDPAFTTFATLNFISPANACSATLDTATNGNLAACRTVVTATITGLSINPGGFLWIRWMDVNSAGNDDGVGIDDVTVTPTISSDPTPPSATATASPSPVSPAGAITISGTIIPGFNPLSQSVAVTCDLSAIGAAGQTLPVTDTSFSFPAVVGAATQLGALSLPCTVSDDRGRSTNFGVALTVLLPLSPTCGAPATPTHSVQGNGPSGPLAGFTLDVEGVVVADFQAPGQLSGFYIEAPPAEQDSDPVTSEGIFVFNSTPVSQGDRVRVRGNAAEFSSATGSLVSHLTELSSVASVLVCSSGQPLPPPVDVSLPVADVTDWERYEGMLVRFTQQLVVTGSFSLGQFGQVDLAPHVLFQPTQTPAAPATWAAAVDLNARSIIALDDASTSSNAGVNGGTLAPYPPPGLSDANTLRVGALVNPNGNQPPVPLVGILDDRFGAYRIEPTAAVTFSNSPNPRPNTATAAAGVGGRFKIVSANVLNYFTTLGSRGAETATELNNQRTKLVAELSRLGGDVIGLSELQNFANGQTNGGAYTNAAIGDLTAALAAATGRNYQFLDTISVANLVPGNAVSDNGTDAIRNGILYNADTVTPVGKAALLNENDQNRPSLAQTFQPKLGPLAATETFTVVVNHFRSKGSACGTGDDPFQGNCNGMRLAMANNVVTWLSANPADPAGAGRRYVLLGDYNAYFGEQPVQAFLGSGGYADLIQLLIGPGAYSFNFGSQSGYLDHALVNAAALPLVRQVAELHINADEPEALEALNSSSKSAAAQAAYFGANEFAASDHDPFVVGFNPLRGDFTDDGTLDENDHQLIQRARGQSAAQIADRRMDLNGDGLIDNDDVKLWQDLEKAFKDAVKDATKDDKGNGKG